MDAQTQDVVRQILLKLGGLESSVARQDETLKAVQDSLLAVQGDAKDAQQEAKTNQARVEDNLRSQQDELCDVVLCSSDSPLRGAPSSPVSAASLQRIMPMRVAAALVKMTTQKSLKSSSQPAQL